MTLPRPRGSGGGPGKSCSSWRHGHADGADQDQGRIMGALNCALSRRQERSSSRVLLSATPFVKKTARNPEKPMERRQEATGAPVAGSLAACRCYGPWAVGREGAEGPSEPGSQEPGQPGGALPREGRGARGQRVGRRGWRRRRGVAGRRGGFVSTGARRPGGLRWTFMPDRWPRATKGPGSWPMPRARSMSASRWVRRPGGV